MPDPSDIAPRDFAERPWTYPGSGPPGGGLLDGTHYRLLPPDDLDRALSAADAAPVRDRNLVVAVGSNASPAVLLGKLASADVPTTVPFVEAEVAGLRVGHSAHLSRAGYIAAAPVRVPGARTSVTALLLDDEQTGCLDTTEPNYVRRLLPRDMCPLTPTHGAVPASFQVYVSVRGVLAPPGGPPLGLMGQELLYARLRRDCAPFARLLSRHGNRADMARFASDQQLRDQATAAFARAGWVADSGLEACAAGPVSPGRRAPSADAPPR